MERYVLELLYRRGSLRVDEIVAEADAHPHRVESCCTRLFREGYLTTDSCGVYRLTPAGRRRYRDSADSTGPAD